MPREADAPCLLCHRRKPRARGPARSLSPSQQPASSPACHHLSALLVSTLSPCLSLPAKHKLREVGPWLPQPLPSAKLEQHPHSRAQRGGLARGGSDTPHPAPGWPNDRCSARGPLLPSGQGGGAGERVGPGDTFRRNCRVHRKQHPQPQQSPRVVVRPAGDRADKGKAKCGQSRETLQG